MALNFNKWVDKFRKTNEASLQDNPGIPGESGDNGPKYLSDIQRKAQQEASEKGINRMNWQRKAGEMMGFVQEAQRIQRGKENELAQLAEEVIRENYGSILDNVELDIRIVTRHNFDEHKEACEECEQPSYRELKDPEIKAEINKRKIANNIIQGEGKNTKHILHGDTAKNGLIRIFGEREGKRLHTLYDQITKTMESLDWMIPVEIQKQMWEQNPEGFAGKCKVEWKVEEPSEDDAKKVLDQIKKDEGELSSNDDTEDFFNTGKPVIHAHGVDFPMLLHETVKGIYELIASAGQPKDERVAQVVSLNADVLANEMEDLRYGPYIAADLRDFINQNPNIDRYENLRESVFGKMIVLPANEFLSLMLGILKKTPEARTIVDGLVDQCIAELEEYDQKVTNYEVKQTLGEEDHEEGHEEENQEEPSQMNYDEMGTSDLRALIDQYLDEGRFEEVKKIDDVLKTRK